MIADATWVVLHGGGGHAGDGLVSFEAALGGIVTTLVLVGVLWYLGVFESDGTAEEPDAGTDVGD